MRVEINKELYRKGKKLFNQYGLGEDTDDEGDWRWASSKSIMLQRYSPKDVQKLMDGLEALRSHRGVGLIIADCKTWLAHLAGKAVKPRKLEHFADLVTEIIRKTPKHWIYQHAEKAGVYVPWYVYGIRYHPPVNHSHGQSRAYVEIECANKEFGKIVAKDFVFYVENALGKLPITALAEKGLYLPTPELMEEYGTDHRRYGELYDKIGLQCTAVGVGNDDLDGNPGRSDSWYWRNVNTIKLVHDGTPSRVVIDVFRESDKEAHEGREKHVGSGFWIKAKALRTTSSEISVNLDDDSDEGDVELDDAEETVEEAKLPINCNLACFHLKKHLRLRIHVRCLEVYKYDTELGARLVLPDEVRDLVDILLVAKDDFKDIIDDKGGGNIVLACGSPGVGKTLTAEVLSEAKERPLYRVHASQLGTNPNDLEEELLKVFARAARWNAILLLDEADVYVAPRGNSLDQNAIVGVFLRVMEYFPGTMFMTTNRVDLVDDAIASRCIAKISYNIPPVDDQARIWAILSEGSGIDLSDDHIAEIVKTHPTLSGRDIKNLLKLGSMVAKHKGQKLTPDMITFVKKFKPTASVPSLGEMEQALDTLLDTIGRARDRVVK